METSADAVLLINLVNNIEIEAVKRLEVGPG
jgi:hypothetical protein